MSHGYQRGGLIVRCDVCPGQPILPTHSETDTNRCVRCQHRRLPVPHPDGHLCAVCGRECPECAAPTPKGGRCHHCRRECRTCGAGLPERPAGEVSFVEPGDRKDRSRKWRRVYWPTSVGQDLCDECRAAAKSPDPVRAVLAALPGAVVRAGAGTTSPMVIATLHAELRHRSPDQLATRIERRWYGRWAHLPLQRKSTEDMEEAYGPDDVALWLLSPTDCPARCEDGWDLDDPDQPCATCLQHGRPTPVSANEVAPAVADRTVGEAAAARPPQPECEGRDGSCGVPVAAPYSECPFCLGWPVCRCGCRVDPERPCPSCGCSPVDGR